MTKFIKIAAIDPSLRNFGMAKLNLNMETMSLTIEKMELVETDKQTSKTVRQNSDDLRRAKQICKSFHNFILDCKLVFAEIPSGAQDARSALSFGAVIGILAACPKPLIQVQPSETKMATVGTKTASKEEMISWATGVYPEADWLKRNLKGKVVYIAKNEHLADAVAIAHAGLDTDQFQQVLAMLRSAA